VIEIGSPGHGIEESSGFLPGPYRDRHKLFKEGKVKSLKNSCSDGAPKSKCSNRGSVEIADKSSDISGVYSD
jgi:hypothetical protein